MNKDKIEELIAASKLGELLHKKEEEEEKNFSEAEQKKKEISARLEQEKEIKNSNRPSGDIYSKTEGKDPETGVEIPTDEAVEQAKEWVDKQNQMWLFYG